MDFKDLVPGEYYKGWHAPPPNGKKVWYFVESVTPVPNGLVEYGLWLILRRSPGAQWQPAKIKAVPSSPMVVVKRTATVAEVVQDGCLVCPADPKNTTTHPQAGATLPKPPSRIVLQGVDTKKAVREPIPENKDREHCLRCGGPTKVIPLFSFYTHYCPTCE